MPAPNLPNTLLKLGLALAKHHIKNVIGDEALEIAASTLTDVGGEKVQAKVDSIFASKEGQKELLKAAKSADKRFKEKCRDNDLRQLFTMDYGDLPSAQKAIANLPEALDDDALRETLFTAFRNDAPKRISDEQITEGVNLYVECLQSALLPVEDFGQRIIHNALKEIGKDVKEIKGDVKSLLEQTKANRQPNKHIINFDTLIAEKTKDFVGRQFVFDALDSFLSEEKNGYFVIRGEPGIGKSAIAAKLVKSRGYIHHFNIRAEGINKASSFTKNICAQLISLFQLNYSSVQENATHDADFLKKLLNEASSLTSGNDKIVIIIDALDEVAVDEAKTGVNILFLPVSLPKGVYFIVTLRKQMINIRTDCKVTILDIDQDSVNNISDIRQYLDQSMNRPGIQKFIDLQKVSEGQFVDRLAEKSQGNFMYLHYALPEIEKGAYRDLDLENLPFGLQNYYEDHWRRMRGEDEESWFKYKLPIIMALTVVKKPVSINLISDFSGVKELPRIRLVLENWSQFLHEEQVEYAGQFQKCYRIYHASFYEFIERKEDIADERVSHQKAHQNITDSIWEDLFGDEIPE